MVDKEPKIKPPLLATYKMKDGRTGILVNGHPLGMQSTPACICDQAQVWSVDGLWNKTREIVNSAELMGVRVGHAQARIFLELHNAKELRGTKPPTST